MKCSKCKLKSTINTPFGERSYCDRHFLDMISKRVRKDLRINQNLDVKQKYHLKKEKTHEYALTKYFLDNIFKGYLNYNSKSKKNLILSGSLDETTDEFLHTFLKNKKTKNLAITPLRTVLQIEMKELCRILKIKFVARKNNELSEKLEIMYPGTKFSILRSLDYLNKKK